MNEHIPTTQTVRARYSRDDLATFVFSELPELQEEFDRWLAEVKAEVRREEQQESMALIGLLLAEAGGEIVISQKTQYLAHVYAIEQERNVVDGSIALRLIKGEEQ